MIGSRDSYVEFSRKRPGTDDSPRVRGRRVCRKILPSAHWPVCGKKIGLCKPVSVHTRPRHSQIGGVRAFIISATGGWRGAWHHAWISCMHARGKKNPSDAPVQSNVACTPARLKLSRPRSTRHLRVAVSGTKGWKGSLAS